MYTGRMWSLYHAVAQATLPLYGCCHDELNSNHCTISHCPPSSPRREKTSPSLRWGHGYPPPPMGQRLTCGVEVSGSATQLPRGVEWDTCNLACSKNSTQEQLMGYTATVQGQHYIINSHDYGFLVTSVSSLCFLFSSLIIRNLHHYVTYGNQYQSQLFAHSTQVAPPFTQISCPKQPQSGSCILQPLNTYQPHSFNCHIRSAPQHVDWRGVRRHKGRRKEANLQELQVCKSQSLFLPASQLTYLQVSKPKTSHPAIIKLISHQQNISLKFTYK